MISNKLVSVIVPIYNVENYIDKCVESICNQSYENIEVILVDDGSPDQCPTICDEWGRRDSRVRVVHKKNGGLSSARNAGIALAKGSYLAFIDGDDFVSKDYIETLIYACEENNVKVSACGYVEYYSENKQIIRCGESTYAISGEEAIKDIFTMKNDIHVVAWNKLYAKELFEENDILYPVGKIHEDVFTTYKFFANVDKVIYVNKPCYYYVQREGSIINQSFNPKRLQLLDAIEDIRPFVNEHSPIYDTEFAFYTFLNYLTVINSMADSDYKDRKMYKKIVSMIDTVVPQIRQTKYLSKKYILTLLFLKSGMTGFYMIRKIYQRVKK